MNEVASATASLNEIIGKLTAMQTEYDSQLLAVATLAFSADLHNMLFLGKIVTPESITRAFAASMLAAFKPGDMPKVVYGDQLSGGLH